MKICKIYIKDFEQFQDVELDFTKPGTGEPLDKICFIGSNGTGKSKLLRLIDWLIDVLIRDLPEKSTHANLSNSPDGRILFQLFQNNEIYFLHYFKDKVILFKNNNSVEKFDKDFAKKILAVTKNDFFSDDYWRQFTKGTLNDEFLFSFQFQNNSKDLVIYSPAESSQNGYKDITDVPQTNVSDALELSKQFPYSIEVSSNTVNDFWKLLVFNIRKRAEERENYENRPENLSKTKQLLIDEFDGFYPKILENLGTIWNKILEKAGLTFDIKGASNPYQLTDNLKAYIKLEKFDKIIPYNTLSTGIRNYIFRIGHIFSLYFNREIDRGFLLVDEPENSLFPDFLFDLMETYEKVIIDKRDQNNTQMFFATHNPIIAAQFQPYERIILEWNEDGSVSSKKGFSPVGDDPNDILSNDFELKDLMGPEGRKMWEQYIALKKKLVKTSNDHEKSELIHKIEKIGSLYNFS